MIKSIRKLVSEYWYKYVPYKVTVTSVNTWKVSARNNKVLIDKHTSRKRSPARRYPARLDHALAMLDRVLPAGITSSRAAPMAWLLAPAESGGALLAKPALWVYSRASVTT